MSCRKIDSNDSEQMVTASEGEIDQQITPAQKETYPEVMSTEK